MKQKSIAPFLISLFLSVIYVLIVTYFVIIDKINLINSYGSEKFYIYTFISMMIGFSFFSILFFSYTIVSHIFFICTKKHLYNQIYLINKNSEIGSKQPSVGIIHFTCNDFNSQKFLEIMKQDYKNVKYIFCDDSTDQKKIAEIDEFAKQHGCLISRRPPQHKEQWKCRAGNWHYFLHSAQCNFDYLVFTDAGSTIQSDFCTRNLRFFFSKDFPRLAFVQDTIFCPNGASLWTKLFSKWWAAFEIFKFPFMKYGHGTTGGFGCMYDTSILKTVPLDKVAIYCDDLSSSIYLDALGYQSIQSPLGLCSKIRPYNFPAFFVQQNKWGYNNISIDYEAKTLKKIKYKCSFIEKISLNIFINFKTINYIAMFLGLISPLILCSFGYQLKDFGLLLIIPFFTLVIEIFIRYVAAYSWRIFLPQYFFSFILLVIVLVPTYYYVGLETCVKGFIFKKHYKNAVTEKYDKPVRISQFFIFNWKPIVTCIVFTGINLLFYYFVFPESIHKELIFPNVSMFIFYICFMDVFFILAVLSTFLTNIRFKKELTTQDFYKQAPNIYKSKN